MKLDILAFAAHPDDVELSCSGTLIQAIHSGKRVGIVDLTQGELGTRGNAETRKQEALHAGTLMGITQRDNLGMLDGFFQEDQDSLLQVISAIRKYQPEIVFCNAPTDRHPDHGRASRLVQRAAYLSGLSKIITGESAHRPRLVLQYIQDYYIQPHIVLDITAVMSQKMDVIRCYKTQFYDPTSQEPNTPISGADFLKFIEAKSRQLGRYIGAEFAEGFLCERPLGVDQLFNLR